MSLPILAKCTQCGREFVTIPRAMPAFDPFGPANVHYRAGDEMPECGGSIELTEAGRHEALQRTPGA